MQYSLLIDQVRSVEWGLNISEAALFCVVSNAPSWAAEVIIGDKVWYWIANSKLANELPLITSKPDTVKRLMASLQKNGLINRKTDGLRSYIQITNKGKLWNKQEGGENNPYQGGRNIPTKAGEISPQLDNHVSDNHNNTPHTPASGGDESEKPKSGHAIKNADYTVEDVVELYNEVCGELLPRCNAINDSRIRSARKLSQLKLVNGKQPFIDGGLDAWKVYFAKAISNPFNTGNNDRAWKANFDYLMREAKALMILGI